MISMVASLKRMEILLALVSALQQDGREDTEMFPERTSELVNGQHGQRGPARGMSIYSLETWCLLVRCQWIEMGGIVASLLAGNRYIALRPGENCHEPARGALIYCVETWLACS